MTNLEAILKLQQAWERGDVWLSAADAAEIIGCTPSSLTNAANKKGTLGDVLFLWVGNVLKISTASLIRFVSGGYSLRDIFGTGGGYADPKKLAEEVAKLMGVVPNED